MNVYQHIKNKIIYPGHTGEYLPLFKGKRIVFTNGCFDILHLGHVEYLAKAKEKGDILVVGLNTDKSVKKIKGENRPFNPEKARAIVLASLEVVDFVILFEEETPYGLIKEISPDILVKGGDYSIDSIVGADIVLRKGGSVEAIPLVEGYSTTRILENQNRP